MFDRMTANGHGQAEKTGTPGVIASQLFDNGPVTTARRLRRKSRKARYSRARGK